MSLPAIAAKPLIAARAKCSSFPSAQTVPIRTSTARLIRLIVGALVVSPFVGCGPLVRNKLGGRCWLDWECDEPLVCVANACHSTCSSSDDCPSKAACISVAAKNVCRQDDDCEDTSDCPSGHQCVNNRCTSESTDAGASGGDASSDGRATEQDAVAPDSKGDASADVDSADPGSNDAGRCGVSAADGGASAPMLDFKPSGFSASGLGWETAPIVKITKPDCDETCLPPPIAGFAMEDGSAADLYLVQSLSIDDTAALTLHGSRPIVLASAGDVEIGGKLIVAAAGPLGGPGGYSSGVSPGPGAGGIASVVGGGGGGSYCAPKGAAAGGSGGVSSGTAPAPGKAYGRPELVPLVGGSAGGDGAEATPGGAGGGAIQIVAATSIVIPLFGSINAGGGEGASAMRASGGGSGGAILLEAPTVTINGHLAANGGGGGQGGQNGERGSPASDDDQPALGGGGQADAGSTANGNGGNGSAGNNGATGGLPVGGGASGGGGGGGGPGRIRINTKSGRATLGGVLSPSLASLCTSQGIIAASECPTAR